MPDYDYCGYKSALQMVEASIRPGKHSKTSTHCETDRKHQAAFSSFSRATPQAKKRITVPVSNKGNLQRFVQDSTFKKYASSALLKGVIEEWVMCGNQQIRPSALT